MSETIAVWRYARALFQFAEKESLLNEAAATMEEVFAAVQRHPEISHLVLNSTISLQEKEDFVEKVFPPPANKVVVEFLKVLVRKRRFTQILEIAQEFKRLYHENKSIKEIRVITAVPLSKESEKKLVEKLRQILHAEIYLTPEIRPQILGGIILQFEGKEINGSFHNRLQNIHRQLLSN